MFNQLRQLQAALVMMSRLPLASAQLQAQHLQAAPAYFPAAGFIIGCLAAAVYFAASLYFSALSCSLFAIIAAIIITGALHEDGFADACDGFGGGHDGESIQRIMKDSCLGSYGVLGLIAILALKLTLFTEIIAEQHILLLPIMHALSRLTPLVIMAKLEPLASKNSKLSADISFSGQQLLAPAIISVGLLACFLPIALAAALIAAIILVSVACQAYFQRRLGGYNGDCLGASQQLSECAILLVFAFYY